MTLDGGPFIASVDAVLQDAAALQAFREWMSLDSPKSTDCLALYFAIKGYQAYLSRKEPSTSSMACTIHRKFISQRTGTCSFLPSSVRNEMSNRVHSLNSQHPPYPELFEPVQPALRKHLSALHSKFVASSHFTAFLAQRGGEGSSSTTPKDEIHLSTYSHSVPTFIRESSKRNRICKTRGYPCNSSTSRYNNEARREIEVDRERRLYKHTDGSIRHDLPEARDAFASVLIERLDVISKELERSDENMFARDLPRDLAACSLLPSLHDNRILDDTTSDEEVEEYVSRIDSTRRRSESISPLLFDFHSMKTNPYENGFAPPPQEIPGNFFNLPTSSTFSMSNKSIEYRLSDSSGFCSSESAYLLDKNFSRKKSYFGFHNHQLRPNNFSRRQHSTIHAQSTLRPLPTETPQTSSLTLVLKENAQPPMVAKIPSELITLAKFRRIFAVSRSENKRFLFKSKCDDDSAPFQWTVINDDDTVLPIFDGKITAECRYIIDTD